MKSTPFLKRYREARGMDVGAQTPFSTPFQAQGSFANNNNASGAGSSSASRFGAAPRSAASSLREEEAQSQATQESSASWAPTKKFEEDPEDAEKLVSASDVVDVTCVQITNKIALVETAVKSASQALKVIQDAIKWRTAELKSFEGFGRELTEIHGVLARQATVLHGAVGGIDKEIAAVQDRSAIPGIITRVELLELDLLLAQKCTRKLLARCVSQEHFPTEYMKVEKMRPILVSLNSPVPPKDLTAFLDTVDELVKRQVAILAPHLTELVAECITTTKQHSVDSFIAQIGQLPPESSDNKLEKGKARARKELNLELLQICRTIATRVEVTAMGSLSRRIKILNALIQSSQQDLEKKPKPSVPVSQTSLGSLGPTEMIPMASPRDHVTEADLTALQEKTDNDYWFWKNISRSSRLSYTTGWNYQVTGKLGVELEAEVGQRLSGFLKRLNTRLCDFCRGDLEPKASKATLEHEFLFLKGCLKELEDKFNAKFKIICETAPDGLTKALFDYASGLEYAFKEARSLLKLGFKCTTKAHKAFTAMKGIQKEYAGHGAASPFQRATGLFSTVEEIKAAKNEKPKLSQKQFDLFISRLVDLLSDVHATKDSEILRLTPEEMRVPGCVLSQDPAKFRSLYKADENQESLPVALLSYIAKHVVSFTALSAPSHDIELELVLQAVLKNFDEQYWKSLDVYEHIKPILGAYEKAYESKRRDIDAHFKPAAEIMFHALEAQNSDSALLHYSIAWQKYFECMRKNPPEEMRKVLHEALVVKGYPPIYPEVARRDIEAWTFATPAIFLGQLKEAVETLRLIMSGSSDEQRTLALFDSIIFRALGVSCFALDEKDQVKMQKMLVKILQTKEYELLVAGLSESTKRLFCESTMVKAINCSFEDSPKKKLLHAPQEVTFLLEGPFEELLSEPSLGADKRRPNMVLFKFIKSERFKPEHEKFCTARFLAKKGPMAFEHWLADFELLIRNNPIAKAYFEHLVPKSPRGDEILI